MEPWLRQLVNHFAYQRLNGADEAGALAAVEDRVPGFSAQQYQQAYLLSGYAVENTALAQALQPQQQLFEIYPGLQYALPYAPVVRSTLEFTDGHGNTIYRNLDLQASYLDTIQQITDEIMGHVAGMVSTYSWSFVQWTFSGPLI